mmetsp:Transcript_20740/g.51111  ORF Transcript_20740/g.51111 Transcript_20740/m.51111 type:complete len:91 (-) Transcript_20740:204-476(-)
MVMSLGVTCVAVTVGERNSRRLLPVASRLGMRVKAVGMAMTLGMQCDPEGCPQADWRWKSAGLGVVVPTLPRKKNGAGANILNGAHGSAK